MCFKQLSNENCWESFQFPQTLRCFIEIAKISTSYPTKTTPGRRFSCSPTRTGTIVPKATFEGAQGSQTSAPKMCDHHTRTMELKSMISAICNPTNMNTHSLTSLDPQNETLVLTSDETSPDIMNLQRGVYQPRSKILNLFKLCTNCPKEHNSSLGRFLKICERYPDCVIWAYDKEHPGENKPTLNDKHSYMGSTNGEIFGDSKYHYLELDVSTSTTDVMMSDVEVQIIHDNWKEAHTSIVSSVDKSTMSNGSEGHSVSDLKVVPSKLHTSADAMIVGLDKKQQLVNEEEVKHSNVASDETAGEVASAWISILQPSAQPITVEIDGKKEEIKEEEVKSILKSSILPVTVGLDEKKEEIKEEEVKSILKSSIVPVTVGLDQKREEVKEEEIKQQDVVQEEVKQEEAQKDEAEQEENLFPEEYTRIGKSISAEIIKNLREKHAEKTLESQEIMLNFDDEKDASPKARRVSQISWSDFNPTTDDLVDAAALVSKQRVESSMTKFMAAKKKTGRHSIFLDVVRSLKNQTDLDDVLKNQDDASAVTQFSVSPQKTKCCGLRKKKPNIRESAMDGKISNRKKSSIDSPSYTSYTEDENERKRSSLEAYKRRSSPVAHPVVEKVKTIKMYSQNVK